MLPLLQPWQCTGVAESLRLLGSADEQLLQQLQTKAEAATMAAQQPEGSI